MKIEEATKKDIHYIAILMVREYRKKPYFEKWSDDMAEKTIKSYFEYGTCFLTRDNKKITGFVIFQMRYYFKANEIFVNELVFQRNIKEGVMEKL